MAGVIRRKLGELISSGKITANSGGLWDGAGRAYSPANPPDAPAGIWRFRGLNVGSDTSGSALPQGQWAACLSGNNLVTNIPVHQNLIFTPFYNATAGTLKDLRCYITVAGASGTVLRLGLYENIAGNVPYPGLLIYDAGTAAADAAGLKTFTPGTPPVLAAERLYWAAFVAHNAAATLTLRGVSVNAAPSLGTPSVDGVGTSPLLGRQISSINPATALANPASSSLTAQSSASPGVMLTFSA